MVGKNQKDEILYHVDVMEMSGFRVSSQSDQRPPTPACSVVAPGRSPYKGRAEYVDTSGLQREKLRFTLYRKRFTLSHAPRLTPEPGMRVGGLHVHRHEEKH